MRDTPGTPPAHATTPDRPPRPVLPAALGDKLRFWSFVSMLLLVFVHGYTVEPRYLQPWTRPLEPLGANSYLQYLLANGLLRFRIPMLFAISGYLFALHDHQPHDARMRHRVRTLLLPYWAWSAIHLAILYAAELEPTLRGWIVDNGIHRIDAQRVLLHDYAWYDLLVRWLLVPVPYQLWFIRVLFFYNLAYPLLLRWLNGRIARRVFFYSVLPMWLLSAHLFVAEGEGLLFFALGVWLQKSAWNIAQPPRWLRPWPWALLWLASAALKTWLAFEGLALLGNAVYPCLMLLHKTCVLSGLVAAWFGSDTLVRACMRRPWFVGLSAFAFMIYALHAPLVAILMNPTIALMSRWSTAHAQALTFVALPLALITTAVLLGAALRALTPRLYGLLTGGRGLRTPAAGPHISRF